MKIVLESIYYDLWDYVLDDLFIPTHFINNEVANKHMELLTTKEKSAKMF